MFNETMFIDIYRCWRLSQSRGLTVDQRYSSSVKRFIFVNQAFEFKVSKTNLDSSLWLKRAGRKEIGLFVGIYWHSQTRKMLSFSKVGIVIFRYKWYSDDQNIQAARSPVRESTLHRFQTRGMLSAPFCAMNSSFNQCATFIQLSKAQLQKTRRQELRKPISCFTTRSHKYV